MLDWERVRKKRGLTQGAVAAALGTTQQQYARWEGSHMSGVDASVQRRLVGLLRTDFDELHIPTGSLALPWLEEATAATAGNKAIWEVGVRCAGHRGDRDDAEWFPVTHGVRQKFADFLHHHDPDGDLGQAVHIFPTTDGHVVLVNSRNIRCFILEANIPAAETEAAAEEEMAVVFADGDRLDVDLHEGTLHGIDEMIEFRLMDPEHHGCPHRRLVFEDDDGLRYHVPLSRIALAVLPLEAVLAELRPYHDELVTDSRNDDQKEFEQIMRATLSETVEKRPRGRPRKHPR